MISKVGQSLSEHQLDPKYIISQRLHHRLSPPSPRHQSLFLPPLLRLPLHPSATPLRLLQLYQQRLHPRSQHTQRLAQSHQVHSTILVLFWWASVVNRLSPRWRLWDSREQISTEPCAPPSSILTEPSSISLPAFQHTSKLNKDP